MGCFERNGNARKGSRAGVGSGEVSVTMIFVDNATGDVNVDVKVAEMGFGAESCTPDGVVVWLKEGTGTDTWKEEFGGDSTGDR